MLKTAKINAIYSYDSTKTLSQINSCKYNSNGDITEQTTNDGNEKLLYTTTYFYADKGKYTGSESFLSTGSLRRRAVSAAVSDKGLAYRYSYTYDSNGQLEKINYTFYKDNGDFDDFSYVLFTHEDGELKTFKVSNGEFEKVKKKHLENRWMKEYYYVLDRNKNG
jgi:hypothetical protein